MVAEAIASVREQTYRDLETILVDDGSEDQTQDLLAGFPGIRYVRQPHSGVSAARNRGIAMASGEFVAFLDSDDLWLPAKLAKQMAFLQDHPELEICQTDEVWIRNGFRVNPRGYHRKPHGWVLKPSLKRCLISPSAVMMKRSLFVEVGGFDESLPACEDYDLWLRIAARSPVGLIADPLVIKRGGHADQLSKRFWGMDRFRIAALCKLLASEALDREERAAALEVLESKARILAQGAARRGRREEGARYLALAQWPRGVEVG